MVRRKSGWGSASCLLFLGVLFFGCFDLPRALERDRPDQRKKKADNTDASWWLLDSGASTSVLAESNLSAFRSVLQDSEGLGGHRAANGSSVNMSDTAEIGVQMHMSGLSGDDWCWKKARLNVLVGSIRHNILSIASLADLGWRFTQGPNDLFHERLGMHCLDVVFCQLSLVSFVSRCW